jgi:cysteinyl-tRNA synthetase
MSDKDLLVMISEMLRKQDQHSELLSKQTETLEKIGSSLGNFIDISVNQFQYQEKFNEKFLDNFQHQQNFNQKFLENFQQQQKFNEKFLENFEQQKNFNEKSLENSMQQQKFNEKFLENFELQKNFNEKFLEKIDVFGKVLERSSDLEDSLKKLEAAVFKS